MRGFLLFVLVLLGHAPADSYAAAIHDAVKKGDLEAIAAALDSGADANESDGLVTPLYVAAIGRNAEGMRLLIQRGADVNLLTGYGTPLHAAAKVGCLACVKLLLEAGADANALTADRVPAVHFAKKFGFPDVADYLFEHGYLVPAPLPISTVLNSADPVKGKTLFLKGCAGCHDATPDMRNRYGPALWGIVGRPRASVANFRYSQPLMEAGGKWNYEELNGFISDPRRVLPGTEMEAQGYQKLEDRADLIAYLRSLSDNPEALPQQ
jgi:cytochrome c